MSMTYEPSAQPPEIDFSDDALPPRSRRLRWAAAGLALVLAAGAGIGFVFTGHASPSPSVRTPTGPSPNALNHDPAPSLAGAYSDNLIIAFRALYAYNNWADEHPDQALVGKYSAPGSPAYVGELKNMDYLVSHGAHEPNDPRGYDGDIQYTRITSKPTALVDPTGQAVLRNGHPAMTGGVVLAVSHYRSDDLYDRDGRYLQPGQHAGYAAISYSLVQGSDGQWRFWEAITLNPPGGPLAVETQP